MSGMLTQLAAATATKGTHRPIREGDLYTNTNVTHHSPPTAAPCTSNTVHVQGSRFMRTYKPHVPNQHNFHLFADGFTSLTVVTHELFGLLHAYNIHGTHNM